MENIKYCKKCNKKMMFKDYIKKTKFKNKIGPWKIKKFCNEKCRYEYYNKKEKYVLQKTYHNEVIKWLNKKINGTINYVQSKQDENADIITKQANYEIEQLSHYHKFKKKYKRYRENKKHIMYVIVDPRLSEFFDEIKFISPKTKIK